jgi:hypothetical protein
MQTKHAQCLAMVTATQSALWPDLYLEDESTGVRDTLRDRWKALNEFSLEHGGLCPQAAVKDLLAISQGRVSQLIKGGQLHQVKFLGVCWVTGNSLAAFMTAEKSKGGRGHRNPRLWDELVVGGKLTLARVAAVTPDRWVE